MEQKIEEVFELGTWLGMKQAFGELAARCSAADAECLRTMRDQKKYRALGMNWEQFCRKKAGISRAMADKIIRQLEEFGPAFFQLSRIAHVTPETYRLIAPAVTEEGITANGETVPLSTENAAKVAQAVELLRAQFEAPPSPTPASAQLDKAERAVQAALATLEAMCAEALDPHQRARLGELLGETLKALYRLRDRSKARA